MRHYLIRIFLQHCSFGLVIPVSVVYMTSQGLGLAEVAVCAAILNASMLLFEIPTGFVADKLGRKASVVLASLTVMVSVFLFGASETFLAFAIAGVIEGLGFAFLSGADDAFVYDTLRAEGRSHEYRSIFGKISMVDEGATLIGMLVSSAVVMLAPLSLVFYIASGVLAVTVLHSILTLHEPKRLHEPANAVEAFERRPLAFVRQVISHVRQNRGLLFAMTGFAFLSATGRILWQPQMEYAGITVAIFGLIFAFIKLFALAGGYLVSKLKSKTSGRSILIGGIVGAVCFLIAAVANPIFVVGGIALYSFVESIYRAMKSDYLNERAGPSWRATTLSANAFITSALGVLFTLGLGAVGASFSVSAGLLVVATLQIIGGGIVFAASREI